MVRMESGDSFAKHELEQYDWDYTGKPAMSFGEIGVKLGLTQLLETKKQAELSF